MLYCIIKKKCFNIGKIVCFSNIKFLLLYMPSEVMHACSKLAYSVGAHALKKPWFHSYSHYWKAQKMFICLSLYLVVYNKCYHSICEQVSLSAGLKFQHSESPCREILTAHMSSFEQNNSLDQSIWETETTEATRICSL